MHGNFSVSVRSNPDTSATVCQMTLLVRWGVLVLVVAACWSCTKQPEPTVFSAARRGDVKTVKRLVKSRPSLAKEVDEFGDRALQLATEHWKPAVIQVLAAAGADVNRSAGRLGNPLHHAAYYCDAPTVKALLQSGADMTWRGPQGYVNSGTALHMAAMAGQDKNVAVLLAHGASVHARCRGPEPRCTPLHYALDRLPPLGEGSRARVVQLLLEAGADVHALDNEKRTPIQIAKETGSRMEDHEEIVRLLRKYGAKESSPTQPAAASKKLP